MTSVATIGGIASIFTSSAVISVKEENLNINSSVKSELRRAIATIGGIASKTFPQPVRWISLQMSYSNGSSEASSFVDEGTQTPMHTLNMLCECALLKYPSENTLC